MTTYPEAPETARHETVAPDAVTLEIDVMTGAEGAVETEEAAETLPRELEEPLVM